MKPRTLNSIRFTLIFSVLAGVGVRPGFGEPFEYSFDGTLQVTGGPGTPPDPTGQPGDPPPPSPEPPPAPPAGDPITGVTFQWRVNGTLIAAPAFVNVAGPAGSAKNQMSRYQLTPELALTIYRRYLPGSAVSLIEVAVWNDPLVCKVQPSPGATIPSQTMPDLEIVVNGARIFPMFPKLTCWDIVVEGQRYHMGITDPANNTIADGAGFVWPFLCTTNSAAPLLTDLAATYPSNPGSVWGSVSPSFPSHPPSVMSQLSTGSVYFKSHADPWDVLGEDEKYSPTTGYHADWYFCHLGAYYARNDLNDIYFVTPTVYRQAARPQHYYGFKGDSPAFWFNDSRPAKWGTDYLGRVPAGGSYVAPVADTHDWTGLDCQHASLRRLGEYARATGSPFAWLEMLHHGELAKAMLRVIDPVGGFPNTPRGYLGWLEMAYYCRKMDPSYDMSVTIKSFEDFLDYGHTQIYGKPWGQPQVMSAQISDKWIPGEYAAASFEDLRAIPILLKVGEDFNRPKMITGALEKSEWYATQGWTNGSEGKGLGIKYLVGALDPSKFIGADLVGYNSVSGLGYHLAEQYLNAHPTPGFNKTLYGQVAELIWEANHADPKWASIYAYWLQWK